MGTELNEFQGNVVPPSLKWIATERRPESSASQHGKHPALCRAVLASKMASVHRFASHQPADHRNRPTHRRRHSHRTCSRFALAHTRGPTGFANVRKRCTIVPASRPDTLRNRSGRAMRVQFFTILNQSRPVQRRKTEAYFWGEDEGVIQMVLSCRPVLMPFGLALSRSHPFSARTHAHTLVQASMKICPFQWLLPTRTRCSCRFPVCGF